jgi:di/tricarboxylate transporter
MRISKFPFMLFLLLGLLFYQIPSYSFDGMTGTSEPCQIICEVSKDYIPQMHEKISNADGLTWEGWFTVVLFLLILVVLISEVLQPDLIMLISTGILLVCGIILPTEALRGFSQDIILTIAMLSVVIYSLEINGVLGLISKYILSKSDNHYKELSSIVVPVSIASAFMNNTPIVLMMTSVIRQWALKKNNAPSKYLIPLSFAAILGGACTLIGSSSNLIVDSLVKRHQGGLGFSFFELAYIGVPCLLVGGLYIVFFSYPILPKRQDPTTSLFQETREFTGEFLVEEKCPFIGKTVREICDEYVFGEALIEIERGSTIMDSPSYREFVHEGDRLVFAGEIKQIAELHSFEGLRSMSDPHFKLDLSSPHFSEVVVTSTSSLIGKIVKDTKFREIYGPSIIAIYREGKRLTQHAGQVVIQAGDTLMLLSSKQWRTGDIHANDFYCIRHNEPIGIFKPFKSSLAIATLFLIVISVVFGANIMISSIVGVLVLLATQTISLNQTKKCIPWNLLVLIGSSFGLAIAVEKTGVASYFAAFLIQLIGNQPYFVVSGIFIVTSLMTAFITNNAAVLLIFPIALQLAQLAGLNGPDAIKGIAVVIMMGASCSFITPIGYQTNMIVYGPGGYHFKDYFKVGLPLTCIVFFITVLLVPYFWKLT